MVAYAVQRNKQRTRLTRRNSASYVGTGTVIQRCTTRPKACTSVRCVGSSQCTVGNLPTKQYIIILLGSRSTSTFETRSRCMKVVAFGTILSFTMNTPPLNAFTHEPVFPSVSLVSSYPVNPHTTSNRSFILCFHLSIR